VLIKLQMFEDVVYILLLLLNIIFDSTVSQFFNAIRFIPHNTLQYSNLCKFPVSFQNN